MMNTTLNDSLNLLQQIHFLRADWFFAFIPLLIYLFLYLTKSSNSKNWQSIIDPQLQPFVLEKNNHKQNRYPVFLIFIAASLCITALAGPVYKKLPQPVYQEKSALVVLLDLSQSMDATDIKPSRLARAKLELLDILKTRKSGQTAFIVYAAGAFVVTPLTDDNATIANLTPALETSMMPAQGSNLSKALTKAFSLLTQAGVIHGNILVITDDIHQRDETAIKKLLSQGHRISIFGIGTAAGGPIPLDGSFLLDKKDAIVVPKLDTAKLQRFALAGGGLYTSLTADDRDTLKLTSLFQSTEISRETDDNDNSNNINADTWREEGHWLLLPLLFFAALWARKGWLAIVILFILPLPQPAYAIDSQHLWSSPDQKAMRAFNNDNIEEAVKQFNNKDWKASALYKKGDYQAAVEMLKETKTSDGHYNKGNALAKLGKYEAATKAYDKAIEIDKNNADAIYNREQIKQALKKQKKSSQNDENSDSADKDKSEDQKSDDQESESSDSKNQESKDTENSDTDNQDADNQDDKSQDSDKQKASNKDSENKEPDDKDTENKNSETQQSNEKNEEDLKQRNAQQEAEQQQKEQEKYKQDKKDIAKENQTEEISDDKDNKRPKEVDINPKEQSISEAEKATEQWLKRIPDDPGGLLKRKFLYQYNRLPNQIDEQEPW